MGVAEYIVKIIYRQWTLLVCDTVVTSNVVSMGTMLYLLNRTDLFSAAFVEYSGKSEWSKLDVIRFLGESGVTFPRGKITKRPLMEKYIRGRGLKGAVDKVGQKTGAWIQPCSLKGKSVFVGIVRG